MAAMKWHGRPAREDTRKMRVPHQTEPVPVLDYRPDHSTLLKEKISCRNSN
ncbi:MAG: hypothetical protein QOK48_2098 [Blastocatellia bacterium]|nr:hypothetical protein [Blastocatellia bacterium]